MRLTLRTLLAYLDDMLDPGETKLIGQKVAESDAAQELIARIKQVTRRRRLTTPPATGPNAFEPNTVADYLDNALPGEQVAEVEKACLESDVHLAEIAAVHQILTLVVSQPALVPPTARQRMYGLIRGRKPARAAPAAAAAPGNGPPAEAADGRADEDETLLLGLPIYRRHAAMRWLLPLAAAVLLAVFVGIAIWQALPTGGGHGTNALALAADSSRGAPPPLATTPEKQDSAKEPVKPGDGPGPGPEKPSSDQANAGTPAKPDGARKPVVRPGPPSKERREAGRYVPPMGAAFPVLVSRPAAADPWHRLDARDNKVFTSDALVSLPGYRSDVRLLDNNLGLTLFGSTYELGSVFQESAVTLHAPPQGFDADLTLDRGAVLIANRDKKAEVRVRFLDEVWDVTLEEPGTEVGATLWGRYVSPFGSGEPPQIDANLLIVKGRASVRVSPYNEYDNLQPASASVPVVIFWDNVGRGAQAPVPASSAPKLQAMLGVFNKPQLADLPADARQRTEAAYTALDELSKRLSGSARIETALVEMLQPGDVARSINDLLNAILAVRCLGALDAVPDLINLLGDDQKPPALRIEAIFALRQWIGRNESQEARLFDPKTRSGLLTDGGKYRPSEAAIIMEMLHSPGQEQLEAPAFWAYLIDKLRHEKLAIRELAFFHLRRYVQPRDLQKINYNPADTGERLQAGYDAWKKLIPDGKLPPSLQR